MTEDLDQVRGVLTSLANRGASLLQPVSTNAVSGALKRRNRILDSDDCLNRLSRVGDVQRLRGGYWLPCPTTLVRCAGLLVAISGSPTRRLAAELGEDPLTIGDSRIVLGMSIADTDIRLRRFDTWCSAPESSLRWAETLIRNARYWRATLTEGMEWYDLRTARNHSRWNELRLDTDISRGPALARLRGRQGSEYFLLRRSGDGFEIAEVSKHQSEHQRLRYALLAAAGNPAPFRLVDTGDGFVELSVPRILPAPESMVLTALGHTLTPPDAWEQVIRVPESAWPQIAKMLAALGLALSE